MTRNEELFIEVQKYICWQSALTVIVVVVVVVSFLMILLLLLYNITLFVPSNIQKHARIKPVVLLQDNLLVFLEPIVHFQCHSTNKTIGSIFAKSQGMKTTVNAFVPFTIFDRLKCNLWLATFTYGNKLQTFVLFLQTQDTFFYFISVHDIVLLHAI
jgi:hypothetical protein